jgi:uncharacterized protein
MAYGTPHADSDVDLLVVMPTRNQHDQAVRIRWRLAAPFAVDLVVRTPKQMKWRLEEGESFTTTLVSKGKVLYEKVDTEWVKKAEQDYMLAKQGSRSEVPVHDSTETDQLVRRRRPRPMSLMVTLLSQCARFSALVASSAS